VLNLQARQSEVSRAVERLVQCAEVEPPPQPYPEGQLAKLAGVAVESSFHVQELVTVVLPSFDPSLAAHLHSLSRRLGSICNGLIASANLSDSERATLATNPAVMHPPYYPFLDSHTHSHSLFLPLTPFSSLSLSHSLLFSQNGRPRREATATLTSVSRTLDKSVRDIVTAVVSLSNKNYRPLGIMPTGQDFDTLVGQFSKSVAKYVTLIKADLKVIPFYLPIAFSLSFSRFIQHDLANDHLTTPHPPPPPITAATTATTTFTLLISIGDLQKKKKKVQFNSFQF